MKKVYQAFDGEIFDSKRECSAYEHLQSATGGKLHDDVELYDIDKYTGELYKLELTYENMVNAPIVVIKTNGAAAWVRSVLGFFPEKVGIYTYYVIGDGWTEWTGTIDELQNDLRARIPWQGYLSGLIHWALVNKYSSLPCNLMSYDKWLSKEHNKEDNSNDR